MASFIKRGKSWQYTVSNKGKLIRKSGFRTKKEAQIAAAEIESELSKGAMPSLRQVSLANCFLEWLNLYKKDVANTTRERYLSTFDILEEHFGDKPIQAINKRDYQAFLNDFSNGRHKSSVQKLNTHVRGCVKEAVDEGLIRSDFTRGVTLSGKSSKRSEDKHLSFSESKELLNYLHKNLDDTIINYFILLALTTGMRFGELVGLTRKDFNFTNNTINVDKTWGYTQRHPEGFSEPKTESSIRVINVDDKTMLAFKNLFINTPENISRLVFHNVRGKYKVIANPSANSKLKQILKELNIQRVTIHELRHTHASVLLYQGVSVYYVSERLGHAGIETTMNHYAHLLNELREKDRKKTKDIFNRMIV